jgi:hypothetical protein
MDKQTKLMLGIGAIALGGFLLYNKSKKKAFLNELFPSDYFQSGSRGGRRKRRRRRQGGGQQQGGSSSQGGGWSRLTVNTQSSSLNIRQSPSTNSSVIGSLSKGSTIWARPSSTSGWHEYSSNGSSITGYVSSDYLR